MNECVNSYATIKIILFIKANIKSISSGFYIKKIKEEKESTSSN